MSENYNMEAKIAYAEYLNSNHWKQLRKAVIKRSNDLCERCNKRGLDHVHHLTYERKGCERLEDLLGVCHGCHEYIHGKTDVDPMVESIWVKVTWKMLQYWDGESRKFRRVRGSYDHRDLGEYSVPTRCFFDTSGCVKDITVWRRFRKTGGRGSIRHERKRHREISERAAERISFEEARFKSFPGHYDSLSSLHNSEPKVIRKTLKSYSNLVMEGWEWEIDTVSQKDGWTFRLVGQNGSAIRWKTLKNILYRIDVGQLVLDRERSLWVITQWKGFVR